MKVAIIHLSDFHIKDKECFERSKINGIISSLNALGEINEYLVVFSGDLANSGNVNEYKRSRYLFGQLIRGIKQRNNDKFVNLLMVPGNHDLCLPKDSRTSEDIQVAYLDDSITTLVENEIGYLDNFYNYSNISGCVPHDKIINRKFCTYGDYKIQFNLINTALFSTLKPDDKELHYFPGDKLHLLRKSNDSNLCVTIMHHSYEWFNWKYKSDLEKTIVDNSEMLLYGHDHRERTTTMSIDNSLDTWISAAGEMKLSDPSFSDSYNIIIIDTEENSFCGYTFTWDKKEQVYVHSLIVDNKSLQNHTSRQTPLPSFVNAIKEDTYNPSPDFTKYFVFPKMVAEDKNEFGKHDIVQDAERFSKLLEKRHKIKISGATNSGKTTLLKYLYCHVIGSKVPLYFSIENKAKINTNTFIKRLFEEQYGNSPALFAKYQQLDKSEKILFVDGIDNICGALSQATLLQKIEENFQYIIISTNSGQQSSIVDTIKNSMSDENNYYELHIKPFYTEKRNELVRNICVQKDTYNDSEINIVNKLIDSLVQNNSALFSLNPDFIIRYTNYFIQDPYHDYTKGEAVFSKIFEYELTQSIISLTKMSAVDEIFTTFEEIAGYMFSNKKDVLPIEEVRNVVEAYNSAYGVHVNLKGIIDIGIRAKIFKQTEDLAIYFYNRNHLAYFIAKYLIRMAQSEPSDTTGIEYALLNICFGINSDIILFMSYLMNNTRIIMSIMTNAGDLLAPWKLLSFGEKSISILHNSTSEEISPPTEKERKEYETAKEENEEKHCSENVIEAKGLFEYNDADIDKYPYRLSRAIKYTEMICKALPSFNSSLKLSQKRELVQAIYNYPRKIVFAMLRPLDINLDEIKRDLLDFVKRGNIKKENGEEYSEKDILVVIQDSARATMLSVFDYFAEISTSPKSLELLLEKEAEDVSEMIQRLMIIESYGNTDALLREAETLLKTYSKTEYEVMIKLVVRKHLLTNKNLPFSKKQQVVDRIFGKDVRKSFLLPQK